MNKLLPIGSVITLDGKDENFLIVGYNAINNENKKFDYVGVIMPFGMAGQDKYVLFNKNQIDLILFVGYQTPLSTMVLKQIDEGGNQ